ncbi:MAG: T9SS type A sorting domain-containing protein [Bacteroidota bacterium]
MKKHLLFLGLFCVLASVSLAQVYVDQFDDDDPAFLSGNAGFSFSEADDELTIAADGSTGPFDPFTYQPHENGEAILVDATGNNKVFVRAKASNIGTQLRMDIQDADGFVTSIAGLTKTLTTDYIVFEFDFTGVYTDGGFGGTPCTQDTQPCAVDGSRTQQLVFFINPGTGGFAGTVVIDYIAFGEEPDGIIASDVFQDHFDSDSSITSVGYTGTAFTFTRNGSEMVITGDGTAGMFEAIGYGIRNPNTWEDTDIDVSGNNKLFIKVKSSVENTAFRVDVQDIDGFVNTQGSVTKIIGTEYQVIEYNYAGTYSDLGFGGTPCTQNTAPCPVDPTRIGNLVIFIDPGVGEFLGDITIDYLSFGKSLEAGGIEAELVYGDHFNNNETDFTGDAPGFVLAESGTEWTITGDGTAPQFSAVFYDFHNDEGQSTTINMKPARDKLFVKAKVDQGQAPLRIDLIDSTGFITSLAAVTKVLTEEYVVYEYDFNSNYTDGGFGGAPCESGPCPVDATVINNLLLYVDPIQGGFEGTVTIDFISVGQALGEDNTVDLGPIGLINYNDVMDANTSFFVSDAGGLVSAFENEEWTVDGDGTSGAFSPLVYTLHNDMGEEVRADAVGSSNKLFVRAKADAAETVLRIDLQDGQGFVTNASGVANTLATEYAVYEYDYSNAYADGGFGGSPCTSETAPCPVDGERIDNLQFFINPGTGMFSGKLSVDWISFGESLTKVHDFRKLSTLRAFPNPTASNVFLEYELVQSADVLINIYDNLGRMVLRQNQGRQAAGQVQQNVDLSDLPAGIYTLQIQASGSNAGTLRLIKK